MSQPACINTMCGHPLFQAYSCYVFLNNVIRRNCLPKTAHDLNLFFCLFFFHTSFPPCTVSHETCLLDQVLELIMNEKPPNSASLFLNEDSDKPPLPERGDLRRRLHRAMERRASSMKERMSSISRESVKGFLKRNLFVLFTVAAVALGE